MCIKIQCQMDKSGLRFNLKSVHFVKFWAYPQISLRRLVLRQCSLHTRIAHLYVMAMQFQKQPTKFGFDWPFCPSNNFSLHCTLKSQNRDLWFALQSLLVFSAVPIPLWNFLCPTVGYTWFIENVFQKCVRMFVCICIIQYGSTVCTVY